MQKVFSVQKCTLFWLLHVWCKKMLTILDTKCSVSRILHIFGHHTFGVEKCLQKNKLHAEFACNFLHMKKNTLKNKILNEGLHLIFYFPKHFSPYAKNLKQILLEIYFFANISRQQMYGVQNCVKFLTLNARCQELSTFFYTKHVVT